MKKGIAAFIAVLILIALLKGFVFKHKDKCIKAGGVWHENLCIGPVSPKETLKKTGLVINEKSDKTEVSINYPYQVLEYPEIYEYLRKKVKTEKRDNGFDDTDIDLGMSGHPWTLSIDMNNFAEGGRLASILGYVFTFTGGAHPNHSFFSVNFVKKSQEILTFKKLFDNEQEALDLISSFAIKDILRQKSERLHEKIAKDEWVIEGAGPDLENYKIFIFIISEDSKIKGIKFIFPPYQVGPYAEGTYDVVVPSGVVYKYINTAYKNSFTGDK